VALLVALAILPGCGSRKLTHARASRAQLTVAATAPVKGPAGGLAIGLTEPNPYLLAEPAALPAFTGARGLVSALAPRFLRLDVDWAALAPSARTPPLLAGEVSGCARTIGPCAAYAGVAAQLRAIAALQRGAGVPEVLVVFYNAPAWASEPPSGCVVTRARAGAGTLTPAGLAAYRQLALEVLVLARRQGARLRWWSPWDEPNEPLMLSPQRQSCSVGSPSLAVGAYTRLARTLIGVLRAQPDGPRGLVLGELADIPAPAPSATGIAEFVAALPADVLCSATVWGQHVYPGGHGSLYGSSADPADVAVLERALDERGVCGQRARIWISETGVGALHDPAARASASAPRAECRLLEQALLRWYRDPRVDVAFQYTFREDPAFPVGLASADLSHLYPSYYLWRAWGGARAPSAAPPPQPAQCSG
jgi:hypothetical protein